MIDLTPRSVDCDYWQHSNNVFVVSRLANFGYGKIFIYHTNSFSDVLIRLSDWQDRASTIDNAISYLKECGFTQVSSHPRD